MHKDELVWIFVVVVVVVFVIVWRLSQKFQLHANSIFTLQELIEIVHAKRSFPFDIVPSEAEKLSLPSVVLLLVSFRGKRKRVNKQTVSIINNVQCNTYTHTSSIQSCLWNIINAKNIPTHLNLPPRKRAVTTVLFVCFQTKLEQFTQCSC